MISGQEPPAPGTERVFSRKQIFVFAAFLTVNALFPVSRREFYPLATPRLFADAPKVYCDYEIRDENGKVLPQVWFGLQRQYYGLEGYTVADPDPHEGALKNPETIDRFGVVATHAEIAVMVEPRIAERGLQAVTIRQRVFGIVDENHVGLTAERQWRFTAHGEHERNQ